MIAKPKKLPPSAQKFKEIIEKEPLCKHRQVSILIDEYEKPTIYKIENIKLASKFVQMLKGYFSQCIEHKTKFIKLSKQQLLKKIKKLQNKYIFSIINIRVHNPFSIIYFLDKK